MEGEKILNILAAHADALNRGEDATERFLKRYPSQANDLTSLFQLAEAIREAMTPVKPSDLFRRSLSRQLGDYNPHAQLLPLTGHNGGGRWWTVVAAGSLISVAGLTLYLVRRWRLAGRHSESTATLPI